GGPVEVVLSDMAAPSTGHRATDHIRVMALVEAAHAFARTVLAPGGDFIAKVLQGGTERQLLSGLKRDFAQVRHAQPPASRADSTELSVAALGSRASYLPAALRALVARPARRGRPTVGVFWRTGPEPPVRFPTGKNRRLGIHPVAQARRRALHGRSRLT